MDQGLISRLCSRLNTGPGRAAAIVLSLAAVAAAVSLAIRSPTDTQRRAAEVRARGLNVLYVCRACGATGRVHTPFDVAFPIECPKCGRRQAVAGFVCVRCGRIIEAVDAPVFRCRHCRYEYDQRLLLPGSGSSAPPR